MKPLIVVNGFTFCEEHGNEYCVYRCGYDFTDLNNEVCLRPELPDDSDSETEYLDFSMRRRPHLNAYRLGAVRTNQRRPSGDSGYCYKCTEHHVIDCGQCFDWVGIYTKEAKERYREEKAREAWLKRRAKWLDRIDP